MVGAEKGPHKSQWIKSKHSSEIWVLGVKGSLFCLAKGQISQGIALLVFERGTFLFLIKANLAFDRCPNLKCQILGWTTRLFTKPATKDNFLRLINSLPASIGLWTLYQDQLCSSEQVHIPKENETRKNGFS